MNTQHTRFWTLNTLVGAFVDLFVAYFLLCGSTIGLFTLKFLGFFGLSLPLPQSGFFGYSNSYYTSLLVDYPAHKISSVQFSATSKFPFDSVFSRGRNYIQKDELLNHNGGGFMEVEGEASCGSKSDARKGGNGSGDIGDRIEKERGFDVKGKGALNYRLRGGFRRRRKGGFESGKQSLKTNWVTCVDQLSNNENECSSGHDGSSMVSGANNGNCKYLFYIV